jgi:hypothetical protein
MTEPVRVGEVVPEVIAEAIARAGPGYDRWAECPSCAATYRADAYQLLAAGLKGGKGVPTASRSIRACS